MTSTQFEALFSKWYSPLCRASQRVVRDKDAAEDIVQEVFIRFWNKNSQFPEDLDHKAYLYKSVYNSSFNFLARQKLESKPLPEIVLQVAAKETSDSEILRKETEEAIRLGLEELPPACKQVFLLSRYEDLSYKEIAFTLDISIKTVEAQMSKALRMLRKHLMPFLGVPFWMVWQIIPFF